MNKIELNQSKIEEGVIQRLNEQIETYQQRKEQHKNEITKLRRLIKECEFISALIADHGPENKDLKESIFSELKIYICPKCHKVTEVFIPRTEMFEYDENDDTIITCRHCHHRFIKE